MDNQNEIRLIKNQIEPAELLISHRYLRTINFQDNELRDIQAREVSGKAVRIIHNGRAGTAPGSVGTPLENLLNTAKELSQHTRPVSFKIPEGSGKTEEAYHQDPLIQNIDIKIARELAERLLSRLESELPQWSLSGGITVGKAINHLVSSKGINQYFEEKACDYYVVASLPKEGDILEVVTSRSQYPNDTMFEAFVNDLVWRAKQAEKVTHIDAGKTMLLLHPEALESILTAFSHAIDGKLCLTRCHHWLIRSENVFSIHASPLPMIQTIKPCQDILRLATKVRLQNG